MALLLIEDSYISAVTNGLRENVFQNKLSKLFIN